MAKEKLTEEEVVETLEALQKAFEIKDFTSGYTEGIYTPITQNDLMKQLNINTMTPDRQGIENALKDPMNNEDTLVSYGQSYYFSSLMYKRNLEYIANLAAFDLEMVCVNPPKDFNDKVYQKDWRTVKEFFNKFDYRAQFKSILWHMLMEEAYFGIFREFDTKDIFQQWPGKYAMITGRFEYGLLYDIDMNYFTQGIVDINCFPNWVKKTYRDTFNNKDLVNYKPSSKLNRRTGRFALWTQTSPDEGFWCFKFNPNHSLQVPFFSAMLPEMAIVPLMRSLQVDQSMAAARKLLVSSVPYLKEKKSSSVANQLAIDADVLGKFIGLASRGLEAAIKILALPTEDVKGVEFENTDKDTYKNFMAITSSLLSGGKVIFSTDENQNAIETQLSLNLDELLVQSIYPQFNDFLNYVVNKKTKKYKWQFRFVGAEDQFDRSRRQQAAFAFADKGVVLPNKIATSIGLNKIELERELEEAQKTGFTDKLMSMLNVYTMSSNNNTDTQEKTGRPRKEEDELSDSGAETRAKGSNIEKGGQI